jgi:hypothetical protein
MPAKVVTKSIAPAASLPAPLERYLRESRRPLASLAFIVPLLVLYEGGVVILGTQAVRNGADVWLRQFLDALGFTQYFLLPALTVGLLLGWHHVTRDNWRVSAGTIYGMLLESAALGLVLVAVARIEGMLAASALAAGPVEAAMPFELAGRGAFLGRLLGYLGAGVYEEMLFRLLLVPPVALIVRQFGLPRGWSIATVILVTSVLFSAAHYVGPHGEAFDTFTFLFRGTAGALFAVLFIYRGFGIAAGTHALYDIFVSLA